MKTGTDLLTELFANVPAGEPVQRGGGRILPSNAVVFETTEPIDNPREWLGRFQIPVVEQTQDKLGTAAALFRMSNRGAELTYAAVEIRVGGDINEPGKPRWYVWHEIGHAVDYVSSVEGKIVATPHGQYSSRHAAILRQHQESIILWTPNPNREYKTQLCELWAEAVACAICRPALVPPDLFAAIKPDLEACLLPIAPTPVVNKPADDKRDDGMAALKRLRKLGFIGDTQCQIVRDLLLSSEEWEFFADKMVELDRIVAEMPATYQTEGEKDPKIWLHYFFRGAHWYITEKDRSTTNDDEPPQSQAFGRADLFGDGGEFGYISIAEALSVGAELDFHWTPMPISQE